MQTKKNGTSQVIVVDDGEEDIEELKRATHDLDQQILDAIVIEDFDLNEVSADRPEEDFLDVMLRSEANVKKGSELLLQAVRTFEQQFSSGQIEGVVFNNLNQDNSQSYTSSVEEVDEQGEQAKLV